MYLHELCQNELNNTFGGKISHQRVLVTTSIMCGTVIGASLMAVAVLGLIMYLLPRKFSVQVNEIVSVNESFTVIQSDGHKLNYHILNGQLYDEKNILLSSITVPANSKIVNQYERGVVTFDINSTLNISAENDYKMRYSYYKPKSIVPKRIPLARSIIYSGLAHAKLPTKYAVSYSSY